MAIVKASYVRKGSGAKERARATIRYIQHRPGLDGSKITRVLYGNDGIMERYDAYRMIDEAERGLTFFRFIISPDPLREDKAHDLNMRYITQDTMQALEERVRRTVLWIAADHQDHTDHRHVHVFALVPGRLTKYDLEALRRNATDTSLQQRRELDQALLHRPSPGRCGAFGRSRRSPKRGGRMGQGTLTIRNGLLAFYVALTRFISFLTADTRLHKARFAKLHEVAGLLQSSIRASLIVGITRSGRIAAVSQTTKRSELGNLLVVAPTRGGKGLFAVSQLLTWQHSVIVNDIKGDLFAQTAGYRATLGPVFVIDPQGYGHRFDPLHASRTEDEFFSASTHLLFHPNEGEGAIFTQRAIAMLTQMFLASRIEKIPPLPYARFLICLGLADTAARLHLLSPSLATQFLDVNFLKANMSDRFLLSAWGTLTARMRPLLTETLVRTLTDSDFTAGELMTSPKPITVYLRWTEKDLLVLSPLVRLLWGSLIDDLITTYDKQAGASCNPVLLLADEAGRTAIPMLADHATTVVGRKISLWIAVQSLSQLETVYGKPRANTLRDNMDSQLYYRPSNLETAEYLERALGRTSEYAHSKTTRDGIQPSLGLTEQPVPLMTSREISQMKDTDVIGFHRNLPPMRLKRMDWGQHSLLSQRQGLPPPTLSPLPPITDLKPDATEPLVHDTLIDPDSGETN